MTTIKAHQKSQLGFYISLFGTIIILLWVGAFKFTPTEASSIQPLVENHPLTFWLYKVLSVQQVSNFVGSFEIIIALLLILGIKFPKLNLYASIGLILIFTMTLSYLFTTPGVFKKVDGFYITDFFILKDLMYLGFGVSLLTSSLEKK